MKKSAFIVFRRAFEINVTLLCVMAASFTFWWAHDYAQQSPQSLLITSHPHGQGRASEGSFISDNVRYPLCGHHRPVPFLPRTICFTGGGEGAVKEITWGKSEPMSTELGYKPDGWRQRNIFFFRCYVTSQSRTLPWSHNPTAYMPFSARHCLSHQAREIGEFSWERQQSPLSLLGKSSAEFVLESVAGRCLHVCENAVCLLLRPVERKLFS